MQGLKGCVFKELQAMLTGQVQEPLLVLRVYGPQPWINIRITGGAVRARLPAPPPGIINWLRIKSGSLSILLTFQEFRQPVSK